jgi:hypothetical protein
MALDLEHTVGGEYGFVEFRPDGRVEGWSEQDYWEPEIRVEALWLQLTLSPVEHHGRTAIRFPKPSERRILRIRPDGQAIVVNAGG